MSKLVSNSFREQAGKTHDACHTLVLYIPVRMQECRIYPCHKTLGPFVHLNIYYFQLFFSI